MKIKKKITRIIIMLLLVASVYSGYRAVKEYQPVKESKELNEQVQKEVIRDSNTGDELDRKIDFHALKSINKDIVGWIYIPNTNVDYPILIGEDNETYLNKDFIGNKNPLGSIFSYADTDRSLSNSRIMIFGHNMVNQQMFGGLKKFLNNEYLKEHDKIYLYTEERSYELAIFSVFTYDASEKINGYQYGIGTLEYKEMLNTLIGKNQVSDVYKVDTDYYNQKTVSLVTCHGRSGTSKRLMVNGMVIRTSKGK